MKGQSAEWEKSIRRRKKGAGSGRQRVRVKKRDLGCRRTWWDEGAVYWGCENRGDAAGVGRWDAGVKNELLG